VAAALEGKGLKRSQQIPKKVTPTKDVNSSSSFFYLLYFFFVLGLMILTSKCDIFHGIKRHFSWCKGDKIHALVRPVKATFFMVSGAKATFLMVWCSDGFLVGNGDISHGWLAGGFFGRENPAGLGELVDRISAQLW
jgi:hypothetical protein